MRIASDASVEFRVKGLTRCELVIKSLLTVRSGGSIGVFHQVANSILRPEGRIVPNITPLPKNRGGPQPT
jgi:hypothetical protein